MRQRIYLRCALGRKPRIELPGGLYHIRSRGNNRRRVFREQADYQDFLSLLKSQKTKRPFYLYAYCLMPNHFHLLIERRDDPISSIMQALLTAFSKHQNRKYKRVGHLFQGRYKATLCQTDRYLAELVRYIHLNPVRASIVARPEEYEYSSHKAYIGIDKTRLVDFEYVLRHFGAKRKRAIETYVQFVYAALSEKHHEEYYGTSEGGRILGCEDFVDVVKHRIGEHRAKPKRAARKLQLEAILSAAEVATGLRREKFCTATKTRQLVMIKEAIIVIGDDNEVPSRELARALGLDASSVSKRRDTAKTRLGSSPLAKLVKSIRANIIDG